MKNSKNLIVGLILLLVMFFLPNICLPDIIIDNGDTGTSYTGNWRTSSGENPYGNTSLYSNSAGDTYTFESQQAGCYEISLWWTYYNNRCTDVPVAVT